MNRENRRAFQKKLRDKTARAYAAAHRKNLGNAINDFIRDGDLVTLNVEQIMGHKGYSRMQAHYCAFVESSCGKVFVAHPCHPRADGFSAVVGLEGVDWTFWYGDLLKVEKSD